LVGKYHGKVRESCLDLKFQCKNSALCQSCSRRHSSGQGGNSCRAPQAGRSASAAARGAAPAAGIRRGKDCAAVAAPHTAGRIAQGLLYVYVGDVLTKC